MLDIFNKEIREAYPSLQMSPEEIEFYMTTNGTTSHPQEAFEWGKGKEFTPCYKSPQFHEYPPRYERTEEEDFTNTQISLSDPRLERFTFYPRWRKNELPSTRFPTFNQAPQVPTISIPYNPTVFPSGLVLHPLELSQSNKTFIARWDEFFEEN